jgi:protein-tyrosine-phosphatase
MAESIFNKLNKNPKFKAKSAGIFFNLPISEDIIKAGNSLNLKISEKTQGLSYDILIWCDYIILVSDDVPIPIFKEIEKRDGKKVINWNIKDVFGDDIEERVATILEIQKKVEQFLAENSIK